MAIETCTLPSLVVISAVGITDGPPEVSLACEIAKAYGCAGVLVNPYCAAAAAADLSGAASVRRSCTVSFPYGCELTAVKLYAAQQALLMGAEAVDVAMNVGACVSGNTDLVHRELELIHASLDAPIRVIIEAPLLTPDQIAQAAKIAIKAGCPNIVTGSGIFGDVTPEQIQAILEATDNLAQVAAAGGISSAARMRELCDAGASEIVLPVRDALRILRDIDGELGRESPEISQGR